MLHFIEYRASLQPRNETSDIRACGREGCGIVERVVAIAPTFANLLRKRRLTALSRSVNESG